MILDLHLGSNYYSKGAEEEGKSARFWYEGSISKKY